MGLKEEREFRLEELIGEHLNRARSDFGEQNVSHYKGDDGSTIIRIANNSSSVVRKVHSHPEYILRDGD